MQRERCSTAEIIKTYDEKLQADQVKAKQDLDPALEQQTLYTSYVKLLKRKSYLESPILDL